MNKSYVYILLCKDKSYYTGVTNNLERRYYEHLAGLDKNSYTFKRRPLKLVFYTEFSDIRVAILFEKKIKGWSRAKKKALIENKFEELPNLSKKNFKDR